MMNTGPAIVASDHSLIVRDNPHPLRLLVGLPFLIGGGYIIYHLADSILAYIGTATAAEWISAIPGMLVMLLLGAGVASPGLYIVSAECIVVNRGMGVIGKRRELWGLHTRGKIVQLKGIDRIVCRRESRRHTHRKVGSTSGRTSTVTYFRIDLETDGADPWKLIEFTNKTQARRVATAIAEFSDIDLDIRI